MHEQVGILGAGSWGTTLARIAGDNRARVLLFGRSSELCRQINEERVNNRYLPDVELGPSIEATTDLRQVCQRCRLLLVAVPAPSTKSLLRQLAPWVGLDHVIIHSVKGIEPEPLRRMSELIVDETTVSRVGVLTGPNIVAEVSQREPSGAVVASTDKTVFPRCHAIFHTRYFRVYGTHDVAGAEIGGAFSGIAAIAIGVVDAMGLGAGSRALLVTRGLSEMQRLGLTMGATLETFSGLAGMGDLVASCNNPRSLNRELGRRVAKGEQLADIVADLARAIEAVQTTKAVQQYAQRHRLDLPIVHAVFRMLFERAKVAEVVAGLMKLPTGDERAGLRGIPTAGD